MKMWLTKYALTLGIQELEVENALIDDDSGLVCAVDDYIVYTVGKDIFETKAEAVDRAGEMRTHKRVSLCRQLAILEDLTFE